VLLGPVGRIVSVAFSPDARPRAAGSQDYLGRLWDLGGRQSGERSVIKLKEHPGVVRLVMFPPEGNQLVSVGSQGQAILWDVVKYERLRKWYMLVKPMDCSVSLTFEGRYLSTGISDVR